MTNVCLCVVKIRCINIKQWIELMGSYVTHWSKTSLFFIIFFFLNLIYDLMKWYHIYWVHALFQIITITHAHHSINAALYNNKWQFSTVQIDHTKRLMPIIMISSNNEIISGKKIEYFSFSSVAFSGLKSFLSITKERETKSFFLFN